MATLTTGMGKADKRIPVTEETWRKLGSMKQAGETWDDLVGRLLEVREE